MSTLTFDTALPVIFMALMGLSMLVYVVSDGYDLGVGMLMHRATPAEKDVMVASIGPFWDANETWLVLGVGILLIAFPRAHGVVPILKASIEFALETNYAQVDQLLIEKP